jgi:hypothetical protein
LAALNGNALDAGFSPIKVLVLAAQMPSPDLGVGHTASRFHYATQRRGCGVSALRTAQAEDARTLGIDASIPTLPSIQRLHDADTGERIWRSRIHWLLVL